VSLNRRTFVRAALELGAIVATTPACCGTTRGRDDSPVLYDPRLPRSREAARAAFGAARHVAVAGDATQLVHDLAGAAQSEVRLLRGVTTDSVPFCLQTAAHAIGATHLRSLRLDRDLFIWQLYLQVR
jgi:hypothetical protein